MIEYFRNRRFFTRICAMQGVERRWFGLESNRSLRRRTMAAILGTR